MDEAAVERAAQRLRALLERERGEELVNLKKYSLGALFAILTCFSVQIACDAARLGAAAARPGLDQDRERQRQQRARGSNVRFAG